MSLIRKSNPAFTRIDAKNIDRAAGAIKSVVIVNAGRDKMGDNIDDVFLSQVATQGNAQSQGVKCRFGHPNMCDDALGTFVGRYTNFSVMGESVVADLILADVSKKSPKGDLYEYILELAAKENDMFGNSIMFAPDKDEMKKVTNDQGEMEEKPFIRCKALVASDLVDSPAATNSLFKSDTDFAAKVTEFLDGNPEVFEMMHKNPDLITKFFSKYLNYKAMKTEETVETSESKSLLDKISKGVDNLLNKIAGKIQKTIDATAADGTVLHIEDVDNDGEPAVGDSVQIDGKDNPDGMYLMPDGEKITVANGKISDIAEAPATASTDKSVDELKADVASREAKIKELETKLSEQATTIKSIETRVEKLGEQIKSSFKPDGRDTSLKPDEQKQTKNRFAKLQEELEEKAEEDEKKK